MPYNSQSREFNRIWRFLDEFKIREPATREVFDIAIDDLKEGIDAALRERSQPSRDDLVTLIAAGFTAPDGVTLVANGLAYKTKKGANKISDMPGLVPAEQSTSAHYGLSLTEITVGPSGDFPSINAALAAVKGNPNRTSEVVEITLLSGFVMAEQVKVDGKDYSFCEIKSEDAEVTIQRSALTTSSYGRYPAFAAVRGGKLPRINALFNMDTSGADEFRDGFQVIESSALFMMEGAGIKNAAYRGVHCATYSYAKGRNVVISGCGETNVRCGGAFVEFRDSDLTGGAVGLRAAGGGISDFEDSDFSGCTLGFEIFDSTVRFGNGTADNCGQVALVDRASTFQARGMTADGTTGDYGVEVRGASRVNLSDGAEITNAANDALYVSGGTVKAFGINLSGAGGDAVRAIDGDVDVTNGNLSNAGGHAIDASDNSTVDAGGVDGTECATPVFADGLSRVFANGAHFSGATGDRAVEIRGGATVDLTDGSAANANNDAVYISAGNLVALSADFSGAGGNAINMFGGHASLNFADLSSAGGYGLRASNGAHADAQNVDATGAGTDGFIKLNGSIINARDSTGTLADASNTITGNGIIFK